MKATEHSLSYYLLITEEEQTDFSGALAQSEMQTGLSRVWTWIANSILYDNYHYAKHTL